MFLAWQGEPNGHFGEARIGDRHGAGTLQGQNSFHGFALHARRRTVQELVREVQVALSSFPGTADAQQRDLQAADQAAPRRAPAIKITRLEGDIQDDGRLASLDLQDEATRAARRSNWIEAQFVWRLDDALVVSPKGAAISR